MNKKDNIVKRIVTLMLAVTLVIGAVPFGALGNIDRAYAETAETAQKHEFEFIEVMPTDKENFVSFDKDESGGCDYLLKYNNYSSRFTIAAKAASEGEKAWLVTKLTFPNGKVRYNVTEISTDKSKPTGFSWSGLPEENIWVCVGTTVPVIDKTDDNIHQIDFCEGANTSYKIARSEVSSFITDIKVKRHELKPAFSQDVLEYEAYVDCDVFDVKVSHSGALAAYTIDGKTPYWGGTLSPDTEQSITFTRGQNLWGDDGKIDIEIKPQNYKGEAAGKTYKLTLKPAYPYVAVSKTYIRVPNGQTQTLSVDTFNASQGDMSYQWYKDSNDGGVLIEGATGAEYTPPAVDLGESLMDRSDVYYCIVTNTIGDKKYEVKSDEIILRTYSSLDVKISNTDGSPIPSKGYEYYCGEEDSFNAPVLTADFDETAGGGKGQWSYEWTENGKTVGTEKTFKIPVHKGEDDSSYSYECIVKYTVGDESKVFYSNTVKANRYCLNYSPVVTVTGQPASAEYVKGTTNLRGLFVSVKMTGASEDRGYEFQWQRSEDGVNFTDIEDYVTGVTVNGPSKKSAKYSNYQLELDNKDAYYRCRIIGSTTNVKGQEFKSEPVYSEAAHITYKPAEISLKGEGTEKNPYLIENLQDLETLRDKVNNDGSKFNGICFKITSDITLPDGWQPIGNSSSHKFNGIIDGAKEDGTNCLITVAEGGLPLLGHTSGATLKNLDIYGKKINGYGVVNNYQQGNTIVIDNVNLKAGTHTLMSGYLGGYASGRDEVTIKNCTVEKGVVIGDDGTWGDLGDTTYTYMLVGKFNHQDIIGSFAGAFNGYIENCVSYATVYGRNKVGGIMGMKGQSMGYCSITNCEFYGEVKASGEDAGGIAGSGYESVSGGNTPCVSIKNCAVYGTVSGKDNVGGIFGGEMGCMQCWDNGIGYVQDNYFGGTIESGGKNVGGIIGYMASLDIYNEIENNYFKEGCGAEKGIGAVALVDTDCKTVDKTDGSIQYTYTEKYHRTDDPLGADKDKLTVSRSVAEIKAGKVIAELNGREGSYGNWTQGGGSYPVHGDKAVAYKIFTSDIRAYEYECYRGEDIDLSGIPFDVQITDGSTKKVDGSKLKIKGYDNNLIGTQKVMLSYEAATFPMTITVLKRDTGNIKVKFTLLGDTKHGENGGTVHTLAAGNLTEWIPETEYEVDGNATVLDVFTMALNEKGLTFENPSPGNYITSITKGSTTLAEMDNGASSGWMFTLNGVHPELGVAEQFLENGDVIVFHYTDDYAKESWEPSKSIAEVINMIEALPAVADLTLEDASKVAEADSAYNALTDEEKAEISEELKAKLDEAVLKIAELRKETLESFEDAHKTTGSYLSDLADKHGIQVGSTGGEWLVIGLARDGKMRDEQAEAYYKNVEAFVKENINEKGQLHRSKSTENSRVILALTSIGKDVTDVAGHNLLAGLSDLDYLKKQGINGPIWALIALNSHDYKIPSLNSRAMQTMRENIIDEILSKQLADGGWDLSGRKADPDMTAMAIQSLAPYYESDRDIKKAVDKALDCLSAMQGADGGYASWGTANSESCAQVVVALTALGIDPATDARFIKNGNTVLDALLGFYVEGGGFKHTLDGEVNGMATEQGYYALAAYDRMLSGKSALFDMRDVKIENTGNAEPDPGDNNKPKPGDGDETNQNPADGENPSDGEGNTNKNPQNTGGDAHDGAGEETPVGSDQPKTGDETNALPWLGMLALGAAGIAAAMRRRKRNAA